MCSFLIKLLLIRRNASRPTVFGKRVTHSLTLEPSVCVSSEAANHTVGTV